jgi:hypothetical protein
MSKNALAARFMCVAAALAIAVAPTALEGQQQVALQVKRICHVFSNGAVYCRPTSDLLQKELAGTSPDEFNAAMINIFRNERIPGDRNTLVTCTDAPKGATGINSQASAGTQPTTRDVQGMYEACLNEMGGGRGGGLGGALSGNLGSVTVTMSGGGRGGTSCTSGGANPQVGRDKGNYYNHDTGGISELNDKPSLKDAMDDFRSNNPRGYNDLDAAAIFGDYAQQAEDKGNKEMAAQYKELADAFAASAKEKGETQHTPAYTSTRPTTTTGGERTPEGAGGDPCAEAMDVLQDQLDECKRNGGKSYQCMKLQGCSDPAITDPGPDQEMTCGTMTVFGGDKKLKQALITYCDSKRKPGPDGTTGCTIPGGGGPKQERSTEDMIRRICNNPLALVTESCGEGVYSVGFMAMGRSVQDVADAAREKIGGPRINLAGGPGSPRGPTGPRNAVTPSAGTVRAPATAAPTQAQQPQQTPRVQARPQAAPRREAPAPTKPEAKPQAPDR